MNGQIVHFEIPATDPEALTGFYHKLFDWKFTQVPIPGLEYWAVEGKPDGPGVNGAIMKRQNATQPCMNYISVASIDDTLAQATALGGQVALPKMPIPGKGAIAVIIDPQGNPFGIWEHEAS
jgi:predicted enzyme related to lactoylglutathione lyase